MLAKKAQWDNCFIQVFKMILRTVQMKKFTTIIFLILSVVINVYGQKPDITLREYYIDAEFFLTKEFYADALHDFIEVYKRGYKDNANINYKIGICYLNLLGKKEKSIEYLEKASLNASSKYREGSLYEKKAPIDVYLYLGNAYRINNMLDKAITSYTKYKELLPKEEKSLHEYANSQIEACNIANEFMKNPVDVVFSNLGPDINSSEDDYKAVVSGDGSVLLWMHKLPFYDAVYFSIFVDGKWTKPENITPQIMSDGDQYVASVSNNGKNLFLTKENEYNSDIYVSYYVDNRWTKSEPLGSNINTKYWESHASISKDGKLLYFASNRKGGQGEMDIYVSKLTDDGKWGTATNLGSQINTYLNEDTPFITEDGKTLYFSSQGYTNMGGYDVFVSHLIGDSTWSLPENLGYPINTTDDDLFYYPWNNGQTAYMMRIDSGGIGGADICKVEFRTKIEEPIAAEIKPEEEDLITQESKEAKEELKTQIIIEKPDSAHVPVVTSAAQVKIVNIMPIFFEFDKSILTEIGKQELDKLAILLNNYAELQVILFGYADALGPFDYNLRLSERRALQSLKYLVVKGIDTKRLKALGKGETDFIAPNTLQDGSDNPEGRKLNRRVEFRFSGIDENILIIRRLDPLPRDNSVQKK
jgi:outer membrane protein OmpA-like peptidoglycan-associated protein